MGGVGGWLDEPDHDGARARALGGFALAWALGLTAALDPRQELLAVVAVGGVLVLALARLRPKTVRGADDGFGTPPAPAPPGASVMPSTVLSPAGVGAPAVAVTQLPPGAAAGTVPEPLQVRWWRRDGHDRLYVTDAAGTSLGWLDRASGRLHVLDERHRPSVAHAIGVVDGRLDG